MKIDWRRIITPTAWTQLGKVDWEYDAEMNAALDEFGVTEISTYNCTIGSQRVWIQNYPYSYGHPEGESCGDYTLPSLKTRRRLRDMIRKAGGGWSFRDDQ